MPITTSYIALLPILNDRCITFRGPSWWLTDGLQFRNLSENEARLISENSPRGFEHRIEPEQKVLVYSILSSGSYRHVSERHQKSIKDVALCSQVVLNLVADNDPIVLPYGVLISEAFTTRLRDVYEFDVWSDTIALRKKRYRIKDQFDRQEIEALYVIAYAALRRRSQLQIPLSRFCSALFKSNDEDRIIDLTIALESIVPGGGEFRFRFPYFLSLLVEDDSDEQKAAFRKLRVLYDARSALVHGSADRNRIINEAIRNWDEYVMYTKQCILYILQFESQDRDVNWKDHLFDLSYGGETLI